MAAAKITDPGFIWETLRELLASGEEFPIKVEGTKTLPYAAVLTEIEAATQQLIVKLVRPLPPALAQGAPFETVFAARGKRYEARIAFQGREGYLRYLFQAPASLVASDRRIWKRYAIRPREDFHVTAQDSGVPGHGFTGPLVNLSQGGLAFRVDRMLRLDDGMPIRPGGHVLEAGITLPLMRVRGFPKGQVLDARGTVARVQELNSELHLCVQFTGLEAPARQLLGGFLEARERHGTTASTTTARLEVPRELLEAESGEVSEDATLPEAGPETAGLETLRRLDRHCTRLLLVSPPGEDRDRIAQRLALEGYGYVEHAAVLFAAHTRSKNPEAPPLRMLVVDLEPSLAEGLEAVGAVRHLEPLLKAFGALPVAFITRRPDPMLELLERPGFGALSQESPKPTEWVPVLDRLVF